MKNKKEIKELLIKKGIELEIMPIKKAEDLEMRMYNLVIYNVSGIQAGIQSYHAGIEYAMDIIRNLIKNPSNKEYAEKFLKWGNKWKTVIIKNGGTSNDGTTGMYGFEPMKGSLNTYYDSLLEQGIKTSPFYEPDLNNAMTAIAFLTDERVFNRKLYPNFKDYIVTLYGKIETYTTYETHTIEKTYPDEYELWCEIIGETNIWLRENIQPLPLARN